MRLDALDHLLRPCLPPSLAAHARLANIKADKLVFLVDSPVWHAKLRLAAPVLLEAARSIGLVVSEVVVKTTLHPLHPPGSHTGHRGVRPSAAATEGLRAAVAALREPETGPDGDPS